ncbi:MAG: DUF362 domain-containing protein [Bacteroidetes bacterium]|jgi:uncharacterized protein (DUF362 family)|nr:DUF362 domain-containing protein [Bacteroidota bacterium]
MNRRSFLRNSLALPAMAGALPGILRAGSPIPNPDSPIPIPQSPIPAASPYHLVAVKGGEPDVMFTKGIEALGGMSMFVKKGQKVVVKPNIGWDVPPERAGNTNPKLVEEIVKQCYQAGAKEVYVFDNTCDNWERCYRNSGIERAVKNANGKIAPGNSSGYYQEVKIPNGQSLKDAKVHELLLGADVVINVPILKDHGGARLTMSMKNLMGVVWDRRYWHRNDLHQCIADFATYHKPTLNVLDAYYVMKQNGPRGVSVDDVVQMKSLLISTDMVAIDAAGAKLLGFDPADVRYIGLAEAAKVGRSDLSAMNIKRISI